MKVEHQVEGHYRNSEGAHREKNRVLRSDVCVEDLYPGTALLSCWSVTCFSFGPSNAIKIVQLVLRRQGVIGSLHSGKTSLVHRYLTGAYTSEESPEGGRFKKEVVLDGQSYLLLIRDEGSGAPEYQFAQWIDAVIFVFSLESQDSFETVLHYYNQMAKYRNLSDVPVLLVGTQDAISESNPRVIDEHEGRQMAKNLPRCGYYETCSTYGLNVERVFKDGICKAHIFY
ncbi:unnamed protein product [Toxocara canis]|uniref:Small monomeric GTPase n=1 Tax=Toxocara canis TaxID=6265 RepID=A0A183UKY0_TOXCA|nr:unnamed protein product [Toxocara canis]